MTPTPDTAAPEMLAVEHIEDLIFGSGEESDAFMHGFAYGRFTKLDSELAHHWGMSRNFSAKYCPVVSEPANLLATRPPTVPKADADALAEALAKAWTDFLDANPDDLTSPEDMPDHALMTGKQFEHFALEALAAAFQENHSDR